MSLSPTFWFPIWASLALSACVVQDPPDQRRELVGTLTALALERSPDGSGRLSLTYHYELDLTDDEGVDAIMWRYGLYTPERVRLASQEQVMRQASDDEAILVAGDRKRVLEVSPGLLEEAKPYVAWISVTYRGELMGETLMRIEPGESLVQEPVLLD